MKKCILCNRETDLYLQYTDTVIHCIGCVIQETYNKHALPTVKIEGGKFKLEGMILNAYDNYKKEKHIGDKLGHLAGMIAWHFAIIRIED